MGQNNQNNIQNNNNMNKINNNNVNSLNMNFIRKFHKPNIKDSVFLSIEQDSKCIDNNEINQIKNIIQTKYSTFSQNPVHLSDSISEAIKNSLQGEWFVFVSDASKDISFSISTVSEDELLIIKMGNSRFHIARIK